MAEIQAWKVKVEAEVVIQATNQAQAKIAAMAYLMANPSVLKWSFENVVVQQPAP